MRSLFELDSMVSRGMIGSCPVHCNQSLRTFLFLILLLLSLLLLLPYIAVGVVGVSVKTIISLTFAIIDSGS